MYKWISKRLLTLSVTVIFQKNPKFSKGLHENVPITRQSSTAYRKKDLAESDGIRVSIFERSFSHD